MLARLFGIGAGQQAHAEVGLADTPAGVDPRTEREAEVAAARRLHQPRRSGKRCQANVLPSRHDPQTLGHEGAVEGLQPRDIGDRAEGDEIEQVEDLRLGEHFEHTAAAQLPQQRDAEHEGHPDRSEMPMRRAVRALVEAVGIDHRESDGQQAGALVVIDDDHVEPRGAGFLQRFEGLRSAIHAHGNARPARFQLDQRFA